MVFRYSMVFLKLLDPKSMRIQIFGIYLVWRRENDQYVLYILILYSTIDGQNWRRWADEIAAKRRAAALKKVSSREETR